VRRLVVSGLVLELALLAAASATSAFTESRGFRDAFASSGPGWVWATFDGVRGTLSALVAGLGGPRDPTQAAAVVLVVALAVAGAAYLVALGTDPARLLGVIVGFGLVFQITLLAMPGLLSTDLLTYATYGRLAAVYGQNPYLSSPSAVLSDPLVQWLDTRPEHASPYGPVWTGLSVLIAWLTTGVSPLLQALSYRLLGAVSMLAGTAIVWRLTRDPSSVLLFGWNPLLLIEGIGNGHNDLPMMVLALGGVLLLRPARALGLRTMGMASGPAGVAAGKGPGGSARVGAGGPVPRLAAGLLVLGLAALVKYVPGLLLVYAGAALARGRPRVVISTAVAIVAGGIVLWLPWLASSGPGVLLASVSAGGERYVNALLDLPTGWVATHVVDRSGQDVAAAEAAVRAWPRAIIRVLFLAYLAWELRRVWRSGRVMTALEAATRGYLVALLLVVTQVLSWYFTWPLAVAAVLGWRSTLARVAVAYAVLYLPVFYAIHADLVPNPALLLVAWASLPLLIVPGSLRSRRESRDATNVAREPSAGDSATLDPRRPGEPAPVTRHLSTSRPLDVSTHDDSMTRLTQ
jgi:hypothetical protein